MDTLTIIGSLGAALILFAFILNQTHVWKDDYFIYDLVNLLGSIVLILYGLQLKTYPFVALNTIWAIMSLRDVILDFRRNEKKWGRGFYKKWMR